MSSAPSLPGGAKPRPLLGIGLVLLMVSCFATLDRAYSSFGVNL